MHDYSIVAIFCEDVRREMNGQETIVGTISDTLNVTSVPGMLPKLAVFIRANFSPLFDLKSLSWVMLDPDGNECVSVMVEDEIIKKAFDGAKEKKLPIAGIKSVAILSPLNIPREGSFEVNTAVNGEKFVSGFLKVNIAQPSKSDGGN